MFIKLYQLALQIRKIEATPEDAIVKLTPTIIHSNIDRFKSPGLTCYKKNTKFSFFNQSCLVYLSNTAFLSNAGSLVLELVFLRN